MRFTKIKYDGAVVELQWTTKLDGGGEVAHSLKSYDAPSPEFVAAMKAFCPEVLELLELDSAGWDDELTVSGLSINEEEDGRIGLVCTCRRALRIANAPLILNTPHLRERMDEEGESGFLPDQLLLLIGRLETQAQLYLKGKRAQGDLFDALVPSADSGVESVTLSSGGQSVTLKRRGAT